MNIKKLKRKYDDFKYGGFWIFVKNDVARNPYIGIAVAVLLLLFGAYIAAVINFISQDDKALMKFIFSFSSCLLLLGVGFVFFIPFWDFRRRYSFLDDQEETLAKRIVSIYNRSKQSLTSFNGINAIQFFKLETHTQDNHILFYFKEIFSEKSKRFDLSKLKDKEFEVPIELFEWLKKTDKPAPDYGPLVNTLLYEWMIRMSNHDKKFVGIIDNWEIEFQQSIPKLTSIHYHALFEPAESVDVDEFVTNGSIDSVFVMNYNGEKEDHNNRQYNSLRILINDENEGTFEGMLLVISNGKRIPKAEVVNVMKQILK